MATHVPRRKFLLQASLVSAAMLGVPLALTSSKHRRATADVGVDGGAYGRLVKDPAGLLDLPMGFSYTVISQYGETMDDGLLVPALHDGMAAFPGPDGKTLIVRNHEIWPTARAPQRGPFGRRDELLDRIDKRFIYDASTPQICVGGTTTLLFDTRTQQLERHFLSLTGTAVNCAGGPTPWGSWLSCEEIVVGTRDGLAKQHGFIFEVPARAEIGLVEPVPLTAMGRFKHEAAAVDPITGIVYLTEDLGDGLLYRFIPDVPGELVKGGRLEALGVRGQPSLDTRNRSRRSRIEPGTPLPVRWIPLDDVEAPDDDLRDRGSDAGAARFARGEGIAIGDGELYFCCTSGGRQERGQIWRYTPSPAEGTDGEASAPGTLELFLEPNDEDTFDMIDNITSAPNGELFVCEDGGGEQYVRRITPDGQVFPFARNARADSDGDYSEFCGATFSPDGTTMFVNIQSPGMTLAITGPWKD